MFWCGASKNHEKPIREMLKWSYKMVVSTNLLVVLRKIQALFVSSKHVKKISALNFSTSTSKIHLAEVPPLKSNHPCIN